MRLCFLQCTALPAMHGTQGTSSAHFRWNVPISASCRPPLPAMHGRHGLKLQLSSSRLPVWGSMNIFALWAVQFT